MRRGIWNVSVLLCLVLLVPMVSSGQSPSINYYPAGGGGRNTIYGSITLTEGSATNYLKMTIPRYQTTAIFLNFHLHCTDGTDTVTYFGPVGWYCLNTTGTVACSAGAHGTLAQAGTGGASISAATNAVSYSGSVVTFTMAATCSLAQTELMMYYEAVGVNPSAPLSLP